MFAFRHRFSKVSQPLVAPVSLQNSRPALRLSQLHGLRVIGALAALLTIVAVAAPDSAQGQERSFGKNKVVYKDFKWDYIQSEHFDIYFYEKRVEVANFAAEALELAYPEVREQLDYELQSRIPVFIYLSPNEFQQTNITSELLPDGVGGFTEAFKKRIVVPFNGSYEDFRHVLHHELTHAVVYDILFGNMFSSIISRQRLFDLPLWFAEGYAEYSSRHGWDYWSDMVVRDATINGYLREPDFVGGYLAYKQGQAMLDYIARIYGEEKIGEILQKGKVHLSIDKAFKAATGTELEKFWEDFALEMKRRYWPEIARRSQVDKAAKQLTHHRKDGSYFNQKPAFSPDGDAIAMFSDRNNYTEIFLISPHDGAVMEKLTKASRSGDLESLHSYLSGISFSPDGDNLVFVAKSNGADALFFMRIRDHAIYKRRRLPHNSVLSPVCSGDGLKVAFAAVEKGQRDLFVYDVVSDQVTQVTDDIYDDKDPDWLNDSQTLVFSSDRPHPDNIRAADFRYDSLSSFAKQDSTFVYGAYNLFRVSLDGKALAPLLVGAGLNKEPSVSPDGQKICFVSNRNGIDNLYLHYLDSSGAVAITDILTGVESPSWNPNGREIAFSSFANAGFDVYLLKEILPAGDKGQLTMTDFYLGAYPGLNGSFAAADSAHAHPKRIEKDKSGISGDSALTSATPAHNAISDTLQAIKSDTSGFTEGGDFVHISGKSSDAPADSGLTISSADSTSTADSIGAARVDSMFSDTPEEDSQGRHRIGFRPRQPFTLSPIDNKDENGNYVSRPYKTKFTPDYVSGGFSYDTFFGLSGRSFFVLSDYLSNHQFYLVTDVFNTIDQSNLQVVYLNNTHRTRWGVGAFHSKNYYLDSYDFLFSDRFYGFEGFAQRPFSTFSRFEFGLSQIIIDRRYYDAFDPRANRSTKASIFEVSHVHDNVLWGFTGPFTGSRSKFTLQYGQDFFASEDTLATALNFYAAEFDYRKYWHIYRSFSAAFRLGGAVSNGDTPKRYFIGGTTNWVGNRVVDANVYDVNNLYFSSVVTPLRGLSFYDESGTRYAIGNVEVRYPFIDYLKIGFPLPITLANVQGVAFFDIGAAWDKDDLQFLTTKNGLHLVDGRAGFGVGARLNMGFLLLRYDLAWGTDLQRITTKPKSYFSLGADF